VSLSDSIFDKLPKAWYAYCSFPAIFGAYHWITCFVDYFWDSSKVFCYILLHQFVMCCLVWLSVILMLTVFFLSLLRDWNNSIQWLYKIESTVIKLRAILTHFRKMIYTNKTYESTSFISLLLRHSLYV
jgi:hypothetical protein